MKIQILSDLHLEFEENRRDLVNIFNCQCDILIIAGDIHNGKKVLTVLQNIKKLHKSNPIIIFVPGNHDYWGFSKIFLDDKFKEFNNNFNNIKILNNSTTVLNNILFIGGTGWWDESNGEIGQHHLFALNDFVNIKDITYNNYGINWGLGCRDFFEMTLEENQDFKNVICISHNAPTKKSHKKFHGSPFNTLFQNDWKDLIIKYQPNYWIFGHTHEYMEYKINNTKCICNPLGYPEEINSFNPCKIVNL